MTVDNKHIPSWKIGLGNFSGELTYISPEDMACCEDFLDGIRWQGNDLCGEKFQVEIRTSVHDGKLSAGRFSYSGYTGKLFVEEVHFPVVRRPCDDETKVLYTGLDMGEIIHEVPWKFAGYDCFTMPLFALLYPDNRGFYLDARCSEQRPKHILFNPDGNGNTELSMVFPQSNGDTPKESWTLPGECVTGEFDGSWYEAARIYRSWAITQPFFTARTQENPLRGISMWVWNRGRAEDVIPPVLELRKALPDIPVALDWYWWHSNPYDTDYPNFWPPREGEAKFRESVKTLKDNQIFTQVYMNGCCWDMDNPAWAAGGEDDVLVRRDGTPKAYMFNCYTKHRLAWMCGEAPHFHDRLSEQVRKLRDTGLSGQYLDMIATASNHPCYNPKHKHERGGGTFAVEGYRKMLKRLRAENPDYPLTSEGGNEAYMDLLDGVITCTAISIERVLGNQGKTLVPVFPAVYHGRNAMALFGSYAIPDGITSWDELWPAEDRWPEEQEQEWTQICPEQFFVELMRCAVYGVQPMVCNLTPKIYTEQKYRHIWECILHIARFYHENIIWLFDGEMLSPEGLECDEKEVKFMHRMIFTKPDGLKFVTQKMPVLLHGVWRSPEGRDALFAANYTMQQQEGSFRGKKFTVPPLKCVRVDF